MYLEISYTETDPLSKAKFIINKIVDSKNPNIEYEVLDFKLKRCWNCSNTFYKINSDALYGYYCTLCNVSLRYHPIYGEQLYNKERRL